MVSTTFATSSSNKILFFPKKIKISIFGGIPKFLKLIVFRQILIEFGFRQFWANSAAMVGADSMRSCENKKQKRHHMWRKSQNFPCDGLLESPLNFPST